MIPINNFREAEYQAIKRSLACYLGSLPARLPGAISCFYKWPEGPGRTLLNMHQVVAAAPKPCPVADQLIG